MAEIDAPAGAVVMGAEVGVAGVEIGHWTDAEARTGCTVIVLPPGAVASGEVRGGAPATREFALLAPERTVETVDAVLLTGGSAFGLAAADGVMEVLEAEGRGYPTAHGRVPIVAAMALYDLGVGDPAVRPDAAAGRHAARNRSDRAAVGAVGAGAGATFGKWLGADRARPGGLGIATVRKRELAVTAVVAANAAGSFDDGSDGERGILARIAAGEFADQPVRGGPLADGGGAARGGSLAGGGAARGGSLAGGGAAHGGSLAGGGAARGRPAGAVSGEDARANTTLCAVIANARLSKLDCFWVAQGGHDGLARAFVPAHCRSDGDAVVVAATGETDAEVDDVRLLAVSAVVSASGRAVGAAEKRRLGR